MSRKQLMLAGVLLVQVLLIVVLRTSLVRASTDTAARKLLAGLEAAPAVKLELTGGDEKPITLERKDGGWGVTQLDGFPADGEKIQRLVDDLKGLSVQRPVVSSSRYHKTFKVADDENEGRVRIWTGGEEPEVDLLVGDSPNYSVSHVRLAREDAVFEAKGLNTYDLRSATGNWIRKEVVEAKPEQVVGIAVRNGAGSFELEKVDGGWKVVAPAQAAGKTLDATKVDDLVRAVTSLRLADAVGRRDDAAQGLAQPEATVVVRWTAAAAAPAAGETPADLREDTIQIGGKLPGEDAQRYIGRSGFGYTGSIWDSSVQTFLQKQLADVSTG